MTAYVWTTGTNGDWGTATNWTPNAIPGSLDTVTIAVAGTYEVTVNEAEAAAGITLNAAGATLQDNSDLTVNGVLDVKNGTLDVASYQAIANATIESSAAGVIDLQSQATLDNVTYHGTLTIANTYQYLDIGGNLTMANAAGTGSGTIMLNGDYSALYFTGGSQTIDHATVDIGSSTGAAILLAFIEPTPQQLTLGPNTVIDDTGSQASLSTQESYNVFVNEGTVEAELPGGTLYINGGGTFTNTGTVLVENEGTLLSSLSSFNNSGKIVVSGAVMTIGGTFTNTGTVLDADSTLGLTGYVTTATLETIKRSAGGTLVLAGTLDNTGTSLDAVAGTSIGTTELAGTLENGVVHDAGSGLVLLSGAVLSDVTYEGSAILADNTALTIENGLVLTPLSGTGAGTLNVNGVYDTLAFSGSVAQTFDNATVNFGNASGGDSINDNVALTLGARLLLTQSDLYGSVNIGSVVLTNDGSIAAGIAGGVLTVQGGTFDNAGQITVGNGDTVNLVSPDVINTGTISVTTGGVLSLGSPSGTLTNSGSVSLNGGRINLGGTGITPAQILAINRISGTLEIAGTLSLAKATLSVGPATTFGTLLVSGTVQNGTIADGGGGFQFTEVGSAPAVLSNILYEGTLDLSPNGSVVETEGSFAVTGASGKGAGFIDLTGAGSALTIVGSETLTDTTITIGSALTAGLGASTLASQPVNYATPVTLTLAANSDIMQAGLEASIEGGIASGDSIVNKGLITASISGGSMSVNGATFDNAGVIDLSNGDTLSIGSFLVNTGTVAVTTGAALYLDGGWTDSGSISENAGTVALGGALTLAQLALIKRTGGSIVIGGNLPLGGALMNVGTGSKLGDFHVTGQISGGIIHDGGGGLVFGGVNGSTSIADVVYEGTLAIGATQSGTVAVAGTVTDHGGVVLTGASGHGPGAIVLNGGSLATELLFQNSQTVDNATITLGGTSASLGLIELGGGTTITLGTHLTLLQTGTYADIDDYGTNGYGYYYYNYSDAFVNNGTITAGVRHGEFEIYGPSFTNNGIINVSNGDELFLDPSNFTNNGTIAVTTGGVVEFGFGTYVDTGVIKETNATLLIYGSIGVAEIEGISRSSGVLEIGGQMDLADATLNVGSLSAIGSLTLTGVISNGTIHDAGGGIQFYSQYQGEGGTLNNVTYQGVLNLRSSFSIVTVANGITLTGTSGKGAGSVLLTGAGSQLTFDNSQTLDNATITMGNSALQSVLDFVDTSSDGETLTLGPHLLLETKVGLSAIEGARALGDTILNEGTVQDIVGSATLSVFGGTFENAGLVTVANGAVMYLDSDSVVNNAGGRINVASGGDLVLGAASGAGAFNILAGGTMDFSDVAAAGLKASLGGAGAVLQLEAASSFAGTIAGFAVGTTIDLVGVALTGTTASISGTTLTIKEGSGTVVKLALAATVTGTVGTSTDGHGGTDITLAAAAAAKPTFVAGAGAFEGLAAAFTGQTLAGFVAGDAIDVTDLSFAGAVLKATAGASATTLSLDGGGHDALLTLAGGFLAGGFHTASDGHGGTLISYAGHA